MGIRPFALSLPFVLSSGLVHADPHVYCANTAAEIVADILAAASDGVDSQVRIVAGTYNLTVAPSYSSDEGNVIEVSGTWNNACTHLFSGSTILNGQGNVRPLFIRTRSAASVSVHDLMLEGGISEMGTSTGGLEFDGGGLVVFGYGGTVSIDRNFLFFNHAQDDGGGMLLGSFDTATVRNNVFAYNTADYTGGANITAANVFATGNTFVGNSSASATLSGGLETSGLESTWLSNNILWNNSNASGPMDLIAGYSYVLLHNDIGVSGGGPADALSSGNRNVDPRFVSCPGLIICLNFRLSDVSPLIDGGYDAPPGGTDSYDRDGNDRRLGPHVEVGAYESDCIFASDFE